MTMADLPLFTADVKQAVKTRMGEKGLAALPPKTVMQSLDEVVEKYGDKPAIHQKILTKGKEVANTPWTTWTWNEYRARIDDFGKSLISLGFEPFDIINIIGFNSPEWFMANFGAIAAGGVSAGIYATNLPDACKYISKHSDAKVVVVEGTKQLEKYIEIAGELPSLKAIVMYGPDSLPADIKQNCPSVPVYTFEDFLKLGGEKYTNTLEERMAAQTPNQTCTLIYTSGTTGPPKAVMITHDNITWTVQAMLTATPKGYLDNTDIEISYLPLSHIAAQMLDMHMPLATGSQIYFAQPDALKGSLGATLKDVRPTIFFGVPRVWEKIYDALQEVSKSSAGIKKMLATWAKSEALKHWEAQEFGSKSHSPFTYFLAAKLLHKAHVALGLDRCAACYVSAAPIEVKILKYFASINLPVLEIFGQSECTGPHTANTLKNFKIGSVGRPLPGTQTKIDSETGELTYTGRHIFAGYMGMEEKTKETIDPEGWLHSGDIVTIDNDNDPEIPSPSGFVYITGRIKELIITAGGENIPPVLIEDQFKLAMPALSNCMVIGDKHKFLSILLCLTVEMNADGVPSTMLTGPALEASNEIGSSAVTTEEAANCPKWKEYLDKGLAEANDKATSRAQKVAKWAILPTDFTEGGGELTPTLKLKRSVTAEKYQDVIDKLYS